MTTMDAMPSTSAPMTATGRVGDTVPAAEETRVGHLIRAFFKAQDARSRTYERWNAAYGDVLTGAMDEPAFVDVTTAVTAEMKKISVEVRASARERRLGADRDVARAIAMTDDELDRVRTICVQILSIEEALKREERASAAMLIRVVQQNERARLEMTCALQVLKRAASRKAWAWQSGEDASNVGDNAASTTLAPSWARTTHMDGSMSDAACPVGCACAAAADAPEPTEEEYVNAVGEATQTLEKAFGEINDAIEELRYELEDIEEDE